MRDDGELVQMNERGYDTEALLQEYLAHHPDLLAGDQINSSAPRRWLLVAREAPLASEEDGAGRWSVDHLFLDQDAVPTIVEVKRSTDTRIRREVVGQMLDYAANAVVYWSVEELRARFEGGHADPEQELREFLGELDGDPERFWREVKTNLQAGKVRLVFVADEVPVELRRVVEFLNGQMDPAEVLAVEIKQYVGDGVKALVPRVVGQTVEAQRKKSGVAREGKQWDEASFLGQLEAERGSEEAAVARKLLEWAYARASYVWWGKGKTTGSFVPTLKRAETKHQLFAVWTSGSVEIYFQWYAAKRPFDSEEKRMELLSLLNSIPVVSISTSAIERRPNIPLSALVDESALERFLGAFDWMIQEIEMA
jgi:hypothetical protein